MVALAALGLLAVWLEPVAAITRNDFRAPSTLSGRVDSYDLEQETKFSNIVSGALKSTPGWRAQGEATESSAATTKKQAATPRTPRPSRDPKISSVAPPTAEASTPVGANRVANRPTPTQTLTDSDSAATTPTDSAANNDARTDAAPADAPRLVPARPTAPERVAPERVATARPANQLPPARIVPAELPPLTRQQIQLRDKIRRVLAHYYNRPLHTGDRGPWELMHAMLSFEVHSQVLQGGPKGEPITAVGWLCFNQPCRKRTLMYINGDGDLRIRVGPGLQGHHGQLLALLAQARVKSDYPVKVDGRDLSIADIVEMEQQTCYPRTELTFKLIGLMHYLESDATWLNDQGLEWDLRRLVREELAQPVRGAACGGTHRLSGLTLAYKKRLQRDEPVDGEYEQARRFVHNYQNYAYRLQNPDGSFSTEWFRGPGREEDIDRRLKTTGHILEWLLYAAEEKHLTYWRTVKATNYLANLMWANRYRDWEAGPLGHAIHALVLYDRYVFSKYDADPNLPTPEKLRQARR